MNSLKLMVKETKKVPRLHWSKWDFVWATDEEIPALKKQGYIRLKDMVPSANG